MEAVGAGPLRIGVYTGLSTLPPDDEPSRVAARELIDDLRAEGVPYRLEDEQVAGAKGQLADLVVLLGGPASIGAVVRIFRLWLERDRRRWLALTIDAGDGAPRTIKIEGDAISERTLHDAVQRLVGHAVGQDESGAPSP